MGRWVSAAIIFIFCAIAGCQMGGGATTVDLGGRQGRLAIGKLRFASIKKTIKNHSPHGNITSIRGELDPQSLGVTTIRGRVEVPELNYSREQSTDYSPGGKLVFNSVPEGEAHVTVEGLNGAGGVLLSGSINAPVEEGETTLVNSLVLLSGAGLSGELFIQDLSLVGKTTDSVTFQWLTSIPARCTLEITDDGGIHLQQDSGPIPATNHEATIRPLVLNHNYVAKVTARTDSGNIAFSEARPFFFEFNEDSGFTIGLPGGGKATPVRDITLEINPHDADEMVIFLDGDQSGNLTRQPAVTSMKFQLPDQFGDYLIRGRFYKNGELFGEAAVTLSYVDEPFEFVSITPVQIFQNFVEIGWATNYPSISAEIHIGQSSGAMNRIVPSYNSGSGPTAKIQFPTGSESRLKVSTPKPPGQPSMAREKIRASLFEPHYDGAVITDLSPGTTYYFQAFATNIANQTIESEILSLETSPLPINFNPYFGQELGFPWNDLRGQFSQVYSLRYSQDGQTLFVAGQIGLGGVVQAFDFNGNYLATIASSVSILPKGLGAATINGTDPCITLCDGNSNQVRFFDSFAPYTQRGEIITTGPDIPMDCIQHPETMDLYVSIDGGGSPYPIKVYSSTTFASLATLGTETLDLGLAIEFTSPNGFNPPLASFAVGLGDPGNNSAILGLVGSSTESVIYNNFGTSFSGLAFDLYSTPHELLAAEFSGSGLLYRLNTDNLTPYGTINGLPGNPHGPFTSALRDVAITYGRLAILDNNQNPTCSGTVFIADPQPTFAYQGTVCYPIGKNPTHFSLNGPGAVTFDHSNQETYVADLGAPNTVKVFDANNPGFVKRVLTGFNTGLHGPISALTLTPSYNPIYALTSGGYIYRFLSGGTTANAVSIAAIGASCSDIAAVDGDALYVVVSSGDCIKRIDDTTLNVLSTIGSSGSGPGQFNSPTGIVAAETQYYGLRFLVADTANHRIQIFDPSFNYVSQFGTNGTTTIGEFDSPLHLTHNAGTDFLFVQDSTDRIQVFHNMTTPIAQIQPGNTIHPFSSIRALHVSYSGDSYIGVNRLFVTDQDEIVELRY